MWNDFKAFLIKQNVLALAIAVVVGVALNALVTALVDDWIMPIVGMVTPSGDWQNAVWEVASAKFKYGHFLGALLNFFIVGFVAWRISKALIKPEPVVVGPATKVCTYCKMTIDAAATRCAHCTSAL